MGASPNLMFLGDSLIEYYDWQTRFPAYRVKNQGRAGETASELLARAAQQINQEWSPPDWLLIMTGANNLVVGDFSFLADYEKMVDVFQKHWPGTTLVLNGLPPLQLPWLANNSAGRMSQLLARIAAEKKAGFLDLAQVFNASNKNLAELLLGDGVHLTPEGYELWAKEIASRLP